MNDLTSASKVLRAAKLPEEIFGIPSGLLSVEELTNHVRAEYRRMATMLHPDKFPGGPEKAEATELFSMLTAFRERAYVDILNCAYGKPRAAVAPKTEFPITLVTKGQQYKLTALLRAGSIADVYECGDCVVKVARHAGDNDLMDNEAKILKELYPATQPEVEYFRHLPKLRDSFSLKGKNGPARRANVIARTEGMISLADVKREYPIGLDFRDLAWIWKRCLMALGFIHQKGFVHGAVNEHHILVHPTEHGAKLIDWCYAVKHRGIIKAADADSKALAPQELLLKRAAFAGTDIWMLMQTMRGMLNREAPPRILAFINGCLLPSVMLRPSDAWALHDELVELLENLVGKPKYRPLAMPAIT